MNLSFPKKYSEVINLVIEHRGCIFGGCVRDFLRNEEPNDIDVSIPIEMVQNFYESLVKLGYTPYSIGSIFFKDVDGQKIIIDVQELSSDAELEVELFVNADFDVNLLAWNGKELFVYSSPSYDTKHIIDNIMSKKMESVLPSNERINKMINKGWTLVDKSW